MEEIWDEIDEHLSVIHGNLGIVAKNTVMLLMLYIAWKK